MGDKMNTCYICGEQHDRNSKYCSKKCEAHDKINFGAKNKSEIKVIETKEIQKTISESLVDDIVKLYKKYYERARVETILFYWELGKRVNQEYGNPPLNPKIQRSDDNGKFKNKDDSYASLVKILREKKILVTAFDLRQARKFALKNPHIEELIQQQDISWNKIRRSLVEKKEEPKQITDFSKNILTYFNKWNKFALNFNVAISKVDFSKASKEDKQKCIDVLELSIKRMQKKVEELKNV